MNNQNLITFPVSLILAHQKAQEFMKHQAKPEKARQVYLNTLAVHAVNSSLNIFGIETDLEASDSWDVVMQTLADVADLNIKNKGKIECRFVLPEQELCYVPMDVWEERIGYVFVKFNQELTNGELLGFVPKVVKEKFPLSDLQPLEELPEYLDKYQPAIDLRKVFEVLFDEGKTVIDNLNQVIDQAFGIGWQSLETLVATSPKRELNLAANLRDIKVENEQSKPIIEQARLIDLGIELQDNPLRLVVALIPEENNKVKIKVKLDPFQENFLPRNVQLTLLSESEQILSESISRSMDNYIQVRPFRCVYGDKFTIKVSLNNVNFEQQFVI